MTPDRSFLRDNFFLVAAISLPLAVVVFFLASSAVPRWLVAAPAYDFLFRATDNYNQTNPRMAVDFAARDGKVEATFRVVPANLYGQRLRLFLYDHTTTDVREIPVEMPDNLVEGDPPRTIVVEELARREVLAQPKAPDGYQLENRSQRGPGIVGEVFGMNRYETDVSLVNKGRVIRIRLPAPFREAYYSPVTAVGWLAPETNDAQR